MSSSLSWRETIITQLVKITGYSAIGFIILIFYFLISEGLPTITFDLFKLKFLPMLREVFEDGLGIARYWAGDQVLELRNPHTEQFQANRASDPMWGRIILRSAASKGGLESATAKAAIVDEMGQDEFTFGAWQAIRRRLSLSRGPVWGGTTLYNLGWLKQQVYDPWERKQLPETEIIQFPSIINPAFSKGEFEEMRGQMRAFVWDAV